MLDGRFLSEVALPCSSPPNSRPPRARNRFSATVATDPFAHTADNGNIYIYIHRYLYASVCDIKRVLDFLTFEFLVNIFLWPGWSGNWSPKTKKIFTTIRLCTYFYNSRLTFTCSTMHALVFEV